MALQKDFLWGGALAAHQFEGGVLNTSKGYSVADVSNYIFRNQHIFIFDDTVDENLDDRSPRSVPTDNGV